MVAIINTLENASDEFSRDTAATLRTRSPSSLVWSLRLLQAGNDRTLQQCLDAELRATRSITPHHEFMEGVRAQVVDKDRQPRWKPTRVEDVDLAEIERLLS
jgi:enoyl-CoA hydratase